MLSAVHLLLAFLEFFVLNWLGKHSIASGYHQISFIQTVEDSPLFDVVFRVLAPAVFLIITAAIWYVLGFDAIVQKYWWVTVYYFGVRWSFNIVMGRFRLLNWRKQTGMAVVAIALSYAVAEKLLINRDAVLPSARGLTDELWIIVIGFLYLTGTRVTWPQVGPSADERKRTYILERYRKYRRQFGSLIELHSDGPVAEALSYAVLIYESFNRPAIYQWLERVILFPVGFATTLGPMQVSTRASLATPELVRIGVERINSALDDAVVAIRQESPEIFNDPTEQRGTQYDAESIRTASLSSYPLHVQTVVARRAAALYNIRSDYPAEVAGIFEALRATFYPQCDGGTAGRSPIG